MTREEHVDAIGIVESAIRHIPVFDFEAAGIERSDAQRLYVRLCRVSYHLKVMANLEFPDWRGFDVELKHDSRSLKTSCIQFWSEGNMVTAQMSLSKAREMVESGSAFVITDQAIGAVINGKYCS